ncbi:MAG: hypothetical protein DRO40_10175 [Thermoprotei archaeon]|nr:MAG: hypothetical protein DRO40_10175 [Thermoprotei archaeon]
MILIAECYANACFAQELKKLLNREGVQYIRVKHKQTMGRDRILKDLLEIAERTSNLIVAVIDYEEGIARAYVEKQFKTSNVNGNVLLGISKQKDNLLAIVFDPNIEDALLCKINKTLCRDPSYYEKVKSSRACNVVAKYLKENHAQSILRKLVAELRAKIEKQL